MPTSPRPVVSEIVLTGQACCGVRHGDGAYHLLDAQGRVRGHLVWHARWRTYAFLPAPGTAWDSTSLTEIALWLQRLSRAQSEAGRSQAQHPPRHP
jgi:hypothetical protein